MVSVMKKDSGGRGYAVLGLWSEKACRRSWQLKQPEEGGGGESERGDSEWHKYKCPEAGMFAGARKIELATVTGRG